MSNPDVEERAAALRRAHSPYVHARVVFAERPTSAKPGDEAVVLPDGTIEGFVGGSCAESTVRAQSLALLDSGESLLVRITPEPEPDQLGKLTVHNACLSGGSLEIFLEPVLPAPVLAVVGDSPIARALVALGRPLGYEVVPYESSAMSSAAGPTAVVAASHGRGEEQALTAALHSGVPYVALVASRKRAEAVLASLEVAEEERARVHSPAGLDIGARTPAEIALSILAELVMERPRPSARPVGERAADAADAADPWITSEAGTAADPVCGMTVVTDEGSLHLDHEGVRYWFCGSGCLRAFASEPVGYTAVGSP